MQVDLARRHQQQHQQRSNTNPNHYMNVSVPFTVPQSTASNYHLVSDPNGTNNGNAMGSDSDIYASDSASSSAASSFVHLPLAAVDGLSTRSLLVRGGYDNVRLFFLLFFWALDAPIISFGIIGSHLWTTAFGFMSAVTITAGYSRADFYSRPVISFFPHQLLISFFVL